MGVYQAKVAEKRSRQRKCEQRERHETAVKYGNSVAVNRCDRTVLNDNQR